MQSTPDRSVKYNNTYKSSVFEQHGYKTQADTFYTDHDGSAAQKYQYETPIKTGSQLNTIGRGNNTRGMNSDNRSDAGSTASNKQRANNTNYSQNNEGLRTEIEWVVCCSGCDNEDMLLSK